MQLVDKAVGQIAAELPASIPVFERWGIDYCCGGDVRLAEACRQRGLSPEQLIAEIRAAAAAQAQPASSWAGTSLGELIEHILEHHHSYLRAELPVLQQRLAKTLEAHDDRHRDMLGRLQRIYLELQEELYAHMHKEEAILFPAIAQMEQARSQRRHPSPLPFASVESPIAVMRLEHERAAQALRQMRELTNDYTAPPEACATWQALYAGLQALEADLHQHIHLENNILFPQATALEREA